MNTPLAVAKEPIAVGRGNTCSAVTKSTFLGGTSPNFARKKRRGVIEKKRRDRINHSLAELRHLIPRTIKKQSSSKLEKAEILQMTVDHLKLLHTMRGIAYFDANVLAMDFRTQGFQECVGEVGRYLSSLEGIEEPHSLGARLLSHLSNCAAKIDPLMSVQTWPKMAFPQPLSLPSSPSYSSSSIFRREITLPWNSWPQLLATSPAIRVAPIGCLLTNQSLSLVCTPSN